MLFACILSGVTILVMIGLVFFFPSISVKGYFFSTYWFAPLLAAVVFFVSGTLSAGEIAEGLTASSGINPLELLILFLSMTLLSVYLDQAGFFRQLASAVLKRAGGSQKKLFVRMYLLVSVLTVFTSNDVVILTFTPFLCCFAKNARIDPLPYLVSEFVAANTWSMALLIGNPTNICLCTSGGVTFLSYLRVMLLPTALAGATTFVILWLLFRKRLQAPLEHDAELQSVPDRGAVAIGLAHLGVCILFLVLSSFLALPMWEITLACFVSLYAVVTVRALVGGKKQRRMRLRVITDSLRRAPFEIIPFVLSMFVLVLALRKVGATEALAGVLSEGNALVRFGVCSFLAANFVNNIPMSVLFSAVVAASPASVSAPALYASVAASNLGAYLTPIGALAGILWMSLLKRYGVRFGFRDFLRCGALVAVPAMAMALLGLQLAL